MQKKYQSGKAQSSIINTFSLLDFAQLKRHGRIDLTIVFQLLKKPITPDISRSTTYSYWKQTSLGQNHWTKWRREQRHSIELQCYGCIFIGIEVRWPFIINWDVSE